MFYNVIARLLEKALGVAGGGFQHGLHFLVFDFFVPQGVLILKNHKKAPGDGLFGADPANQVEIVLLQAAAAGILLFAHTFLDILQMLAGIRLAGNTFELQLDGTDFKQRGEGIDDTALFPCRITLMNVSSIW